ncbi:hypothetical protein AL013_02395 [Mariprofundus ferrooxydans]|nr:hypothetical protein AL013_02395 [Mariprofundus ferrooxydans]
MRIRVLSDIHLEDGDFDVPDVEADVVVLAGDIGVGVEGILWAKESFDLPVVYVAGNHEYHDSVFTMDEHMAMMKAAVEGSNVRVLDNNSVVIGGVRFLGTTLWTGASQLLPCDQNIMMDWDVDDGYFSVDSLQRIHSQNVEWLERELSNSYGGKTVVISHHAPSLSSVHQKYDKHPQKDCYVTSLEWLMGDNIALWVHGHTHDSFDYAVMGTRVVCNPRGYSDCNGSENDAFDGMKVINI